MNATDYGQFGSYTTGMDPCTNSAGGWGGAFRALLNTSWDGKVVRVNPNNASDIKVVAKGFHNP